MTAAGNEAKTSTSSARDFDFLILLNIILLSFILQRPFEGYCFLFILFCKFEVFSFILVLENKCNCSPHKSALSCFVAFSLPCPGLLCHFLSLWCLYLILFSMLASCIYIYNICMYSPSVSLVLCELLNVMLSVCLWLLAYCLF